MITFIVPSFNQGDFIAYTIDSIISNMDLEDQLIIADGASRDNTAEVVAPYLTDERIEWYSEPDQGFSDAMSKALKRVRNPIVGIMSSDDAYKPDIRNRVLALFNEDPQLVLVYGNYEMIDIENRKVGEFIHSEGNLEDILSLRVILPQSSVFFRHEVLEGQRILNLKHDYVADVVLFNQICMKGKFLYVPEIWSQVRKHGGSRSGRFDPGLQYLNAIETALDDMPDEIKDKARAGAILLHSRHQATSKSRFKAIRSLLAALLIDPKLFNHWLLPRTIAYILFGASGIRSLHWLRQKTVH